MGVSGGVLSYNVEIHIMSLLAIFIGHILEDLAIYDLIKLKIFTN